MKKITSLSLVLAFLFCFLQIEASKAQVMLKEVSLKKQIDNSSLVVEGEVVSKQSYWDTDKKNIYTSNTIKVYKVFKGEQIANIEVITIGGTVGSEALIVSPSLKLKKGDIGVFALYDNNTQLDKYGKSSRKQFKPYGSLQGFYRYNLYDDVAFNPFSKKQGIKSSFYDEIMNHTKSNYIKVSDFEVASKQSKSNQSKSLLPPTSITFTPTTGSAGTKTVLTISGTGFGTTKGQVGFSNADDGGDTFALALESQILTWSDTEITVEIPSEAGTGPILVQDNGAVNGTSSGDLTITYAESNAIFDPDDETQSGGSNGTLGSYAYPTRHVNDNGSGGYTWEMQTQFFNNSEFPGAKSAFENALDKWRCETKVNWTISNSATTVDVIASDGVNVVKFDNSAIPDDDLEDGVLGQCFTRISGCGFIGNPSSWKAHVIEMDISFDDETDWYFGNGLPAFSQYDFESVALHELGHGHQLSHVNDLVIDGDNLDDIMHYSLQNSEQQRALSAGNKTATNNVQGRSNSIVACSQTVMTDSTICNLSVEEDELNNAIRIFPNPAKSRFFVKNESFINLQKAVIYDLSGRKISEYDLSNSSKTKTINVVGMAKGVYLVNIHSENAKISKKLILD
tara:strand:+ start:2937 stop:4808 length:1872 start_codon:yes stop_codon:yes gene_type:complete